MPLENSNDDLIETAMQETGPSEARLKNEKARTVFDWGAMLKLVKEAIRSKRELTQIQTEIQQKRNIRKMSARFLPVVVFGSNNFPPPFSTERNYKEYNFSLQTILFFFH